jgi:very-short-patch-repair endonuclease
MSNSLLSNRTGAERSFAKALKSRKINFLHNVYLEGYEVDFYIPESKVAIEIDGFHHLSLDKHHADLRKDQILTERGITLFRITNQQIRTDLSACLIQIETYLKNYKAYTGSTNINTEWKDSLRLFQPENPPVQPKKFRTIEEYFLSLDDK